MQHISRRQLLKSIGAWGACALMASGSAARFAFADVPHNKKLLVVILRGAMDGLAAVIPHGDKAYADARGAMAMPQTPEALIDLDGFFALHAALGPLADLYAQRQLIMMHAAATPYRERSHFDAQSLLENGSDKPHGLMTGWLNRTVMALPRKTGAIAIGPAIPFVLRGEAEVGSWAPSVLPDVDEDYLMRVMHMYQSDPLLLSALGNAKAMQKISGGLQETGNKNFASLMEKAAAFMKGETGASIGAVDIGGWDTHAGQGLQTGRLASNFTLLTNGITAYRNTMGDEWRNTAVLLLTEFGRTVKANGTGGTDHGTASVAFLLGGAVEGGKVIGDWPGLTKLYEDRDLIPANDVRALIKAVLTQHLGIEHAVVETTILPVSKQAILTERLFTSS